MTYAITLSEHQEEAARAVQEWYDYYTSDAPVEVPQVFVLAGYAGTGKTTVTKEIIDRLQVKPRYMAYTGKAALVMNNYNDVGATTIHSTIYKLQVVADSVFEGLYEQLNKAAGAEAEEIQKQIDDLKKPKFRLNDEAFLDSGVELLVLDECSMVNEEILQDLKSFGLPILALGDPGQLPPVDGTGALFKGLPNAMLTEIRRQALDNPIIKWSMWAREKRTLPSTDMDTIYTDQAAKVPWSCFGPAAIFELMLKHDVTICWKNVTRRRLNNFYRKMSGRAEQDPVFPVVGDRLIITRNDRELGLFNGEFVTVVEMGEVYDTFIRVHAKPDSSEAVVKLDLLRAPFEEYHDPDAKKKLRPWDYRGRQEADFGYAITCHKSQGSQWPMVLIVEENALNWPKAYDDRAKWLYTGVTRAAEKLTILSGKV